MKALLDFCEREQRWLLDTIEALVRLESPTGNADAVNRCRSELEWRAALLAALLRRILAA